MTEHVTFEVDAAELSTLQRLLVVDMSAFFEDPQVPLWDEDRIWEVMAWGDIHTADSQWDRIAVVSPTLSPTSYCNSSFRRAWSDWANHMSYERWLKVSLTHAGGSDYDDWYGMGDAHMFATIRFYPKEFFKYFDTKAPHQAGHTNTLAAHDPWGYILSQHHGLSLGQGWRSTRTVSSLLERLADGDATARTSSDYPGAEPIKEICVLERIGDRLRLRAFTVPRSSDPNGYISIT